MKRALPLLLCLGMFMFFRLLPAQNTMPVNSASTPHGSMSCQITDLGVDGLILEYQFMPLKIQKQEAAGTDWDRISIDGYSHLQEIGKPALPARFEFVAIPNHAHARVEIVDIQTEVISNIWVHPALQPASDEAGAEEPQFEIDEQFYKSQQLWPAEAVQINEIRKYRGNDLALLQVCPVQYQPAAKKLIRIKEMKVRIVFEQATQFFDAFTPSPLFVAQYPTMVLNGKSVQKALQVQQQASAAISLREENLNYIIITHDKYRAAAEKLANWKRQLGYGVELLSGSNWTTDLVEAELTERYENWEPKPDYFLIIGDNPDVPGHILQEPSANDNYASDLYYACFDGPYDWHPDMAHGRISVTSAEQAMVVVDKIIKYERNPVSDPSFYQKSLHCAYFQHAGGGYAERRFAQTAEELRDYMIDEQGFDVERVFVTDQSVNPMRWNNGYYSAGENLPDYLKKPAFAWDGDASDIRNGIDEGALYVLHRDHGFVGGWGDPYFSTNDVDALNNGDKLPVVMSINCLTGKFYDNECFAERFLRKENGGCVGIFAHAEVSYSGFNDALAMGLFDAIWADPGFEPHFTGSGGNSNPNLPAHDPILTMGDVVTHSLMYMETAWGGYASSRQYTYELFHYHGDPAMKMWTQAPTAITATHADTIYGQTTDEFTISACNEADALATLVVNNELVAKAQLNGGTCTFDLDAIAGDFAVLTLSKVNRIPYVDTLFIAGPPAVHFVLDKDETCDGELAFSDQSVGNPQSWLWNFGDGQTSTEQNPVHLYASNGVYSVQLKVHNEWGVDSLTLIDCIRVERPEVPLVNEVTICNGESTTLQAEGTGVIQWFDEAGNELATGPTYTTPALTQTTYYQVNQTGMRTDYIGRENNGGGSDYSNSFGGLVFDCMAPLVLKSTKVYANSAGVRTFKVVRADFSTVFELEIELEQGEQRVDFNLDVPVENDLKLVCMPGGDLALNMGGNAYPYVLGESMLIKESTFVPDPQKYYYFFYEIEVETNACVSPFEQVPVYVESTPESAFSLNNNDPEITFIDESVDAQSWTWDFGDGYTSTEQNPVHTYTEVGEYQVRLIVSNSCGSDTTTKTLPIYAPGINELQSLKALNIYPNPANEKVYIEFSSLMQQAVFIELVDVSGRVMNQKSWQCDKGAKKLLLMVNQLSKGIYTIRIITKEGVLKKKLVLQ